MSKEIVSQKDYEFQIFNDPYLMDKVCNHIAMGGSAIDIAETLRINYATLITWIRSESTRLKRYEQSLVFRNEWAKEKVLKEIRDLGTFDIRKVLGVNGEVLPASEWPDEIAKAVVSIDVSEETNGYENIGWLKKVKFVDKLKALEMSAKNLSLLTEKHEVSGNLTLDQLIMATQRSDKKDLP